MGEQVDWLPNYTGPYISDGKIQESVEFGTTPPKDALDALSRLHDSAYAHWDDYGHRAAADSIYKKETQKLEGSLPALAGNLVVYGNQVVNSASKLIETSKFGLAGLIYSGIKNMYDLNDYMLNEKKYKNEVLEYYKTDPLPQFQFVGEKKIIKTNQSDPVVVITDESGAYNPNKLMAGGLGSFVQTPVSMPNYDKRNDFSTYDGINIPNGYNDVKFLTYNDSGFVGPHYYQNWEREISHFRRRHRRKRGRSEQKKFKNKKN